jgi:hypothetical protein
LATQFTLCASQQLLLAPPMLSAITNRLQELASADTAAVEHQQRLVAAKGELSRIETEIELANTNLQRARSDEEYAVIADGREKLKLRAVELAETIRNHERETSSSGRTEDEIAKALQLLHRLSELAHGTKTLETTRELFEFRNTRLFLKFVDFQLKKRIVRRIAGGVVTFGSTPAPIEIYAGRTDRAAAKLENTAGALPSDRKVDGVRQPR